MARPTLHLTVGLPGVGKTTLARRLEADTGALRLTPDEWMLPLFGDQADEVNADGRRDVLEGRLIWTADRVLRGGLDVVLDLGCWSADERWALRDLATRAGADFALHPLSLPEEERRARAAARRRESPHETFEMTPADHDRWVAQYEAPTAVELAGHPVPAPPPGFDDWPAWASWRWPSLPRLDL